jgi:hypothetical protein
MIKIIVVPKRNYLFGTWQFGKIDVLVDSNMQD